MKTKKVKEKKNILSIQAMTKVSKSGDLEAIASDETIDRMGDKIKVNDWDFKNFLKNPVLQAGHDYRPQFTIGIARNLRVEGRKVKFTPVFHDATELAKSISKMYKEKFLRAWSVGFIPGGNEEDEDGKSISKSMNELLEISAVAVPANPNALTSVKSLTHDAEKYDDKTINSIQKWVEKESEIKKKKEKKKFAGIKKLAEGVPKKKIRWNKALSKAFDVSGMNSRPTSFQYNLYTKFLGCKVKDIYINAYLIPSPLLGSYLGGLKSVLNEYDLNDTRSFNWDGDEMPPGYEAIQLNSEKKEDFLVDGIRFYDASNKALAVKYTPTWYGLQVLLITSVKNKKWNAELMEKVHAWVKKNNYLKNEKFALNGEFIEKTEENWESLVLPKSISEPVQKGLKVLDDKKKSRGMLFIGSPGNGKTMTGRVVMNEVDSTFIWVSSRDFRKVDPTTALSLAFSLARDLAPSVLFIEDIDTWLKDYTIDLLKTELDGIRQNKGLLTILTSNFPEELPDALLDRPGRFSDVLEFGVPDVIIRKKMLQKWVSKIDKKLLGEIIEKTEGFSVAYIKELVEFAEVIADDDNISISKALLKSLERLIEQRKLIERIKQDKKKVEKSIDDAMELVMKEGRIISTKNKKTITNTISKMRDSITALEKLLQLSEPTPRSEVEVGKDPDEKAKGCDIKVEKTLARSDKPPTIAIEAEVMRRALKKIARNSNFLLNKLNK